MCKKMNHLKVIFKQSVALALIRRFIKVYLTSKQQLAHSLSISENNNKWCLIKLIIISRNKIKLLPLTKNKCSPCVL